MLRPKSSCLLIAGSQEARSMRGAISGIDRLMRVAEIVDVPHIFVTYDSGDPDHEVEVPPNLHDNASREFPMVPDASDWRQTALAKALHKSGRRQILICGSWLEESVSLLAHHAMQVGLDVFVAIDASPALQPYQVLTLQLRFMQHNIVVTTAEQALREWIAFASRVQKTAASPFLTLSTPNSP